MSLLHYVGILLVFLTILIIGLTSAKTVDSKTFAGERTSNSMIVTGALVGTLVGGSSTIGTAQLAYNYGFSAWWFTLGGGIGVLFLGFLLKGKFYDSGIKTLPELIEKEYGQKCSSTVTIFNTLGTFLSIVAQVISATALITTMASISSALAVVVTIALIVIYVVFGGALSLGYAGTAKTIFVTLSIALCGAVAIIQQGGIGGYTDSLDASRYFSVIARGASVDLGAGLSLIVGVLTTQSYISAIMMAKDKRELTKGTILTGALVPLIGVFGIFIGLYMRLNFPDIDSKKALPLFIMEKMPPIIAGIMIGTLLLAVIGTAAGLSFGISKMVIKNFASRINKGEIFVSRMLIVVILVIAGLVSLGDSGNLILSWSFMSMGLRGAAAIIPMLTAIILPGKISYKWIFISIIVGPVFTLVGKIVLPSSVDSLFLGIFSSLLVACVGLLHGKIKN